MTAAKNERDTMTVCPPDYSDGENPGVLFSSNNK